MTGAAASRRILVVAYFYPPMNIIGARRPAALVKHLRRAGHQVAVLTSVHAGRGSDGAPDRLLRTRDLLATDLNWRRANLDAITGRAQAADATWSPGFNLWGALFVPDVQLLSWVPFAVGAARRLQRSFAPDAVITTSPTESTHLVGWALRRRGVPWVADLRDGWRFEAPRPDFPLAGQRRLDAALERLVVRGADAVVTVSAPLAADLRSRHGVAAEVITNGFDPDDAPPADVGAPELDPARVSLVHTGGMGHGRTLAPVLDALDRLAAEDPTVADRVEVVLAGARTGADRELYERPGASRFVRHLGFVDRARSLALQRDADWLVLVTTGTRTGEATGKLFEYLAARRPILVLGEGSAAGDIVAREDAGLVIPTRDSAAAEAALRRILAGAAHPPAPSPGARDRYLWPALAARFEEVVERAIAGQSAEGGPTPSEPITPTAAR